MPRSCRTRTLTPDTGHRGADEHDRCGIYLLWIPLGAGGVGFVRFNGWIYETVRALIERRPRLDLYHTALVVTAPSGRFVIENAWPSPDANTTTRGVVVEGPVFHRRISRLRMFRYEVRCWLDGDIRDATHAVGGPQLVSTDPDKVRRILELVQFVPAMVWGRDETATGEMWNSNSVVSWLLAGTGVLTEEVQPPMGGRAPGWNTGIAVVNSEARPSVTGATQT